LPFVKCRLFMVNGTDDFAYPLDIHRESFELAPDADVRLQVAMNHSHVAGWVPKEIGAYVDSVLCGGEPLPCLEQIKMEPAKNGITVSAHIKYDAKPEAATLYYTSDKGGYNENNQWQVRKWESIPAKIEGDTVTAILPADIIVTPVRFFLEARDNRGLTASTHYEITPDNNVGQLAIPSLSNAHAHNDYWHKRPLIDALEQGFCSVEADVFLIGEKLLVGHDMFELRPERTLEALYLQPLLARTQKYDGKVFPDAQDFYLWIDLKTDGNEMYTVLSETLSKYQDMLTHFTPDGKMQKRGVTVIISGSTPREKILNEKNTRYMSIDGRQSDFGSEISSDFIPVISEPWGSHFTWKGNGEMSAEELEKLREYAKQTGVKGRKLRFWGTPDKPEVWGTAYKNGVYFINTDKLPELREFLLKTDKP
ncbi:MAG: phosphatidylinositol-specific phospholipase C/glycerophosphodiester phosphodiesterase family protein, partial [Thermoguttaceae bacterium]